MPQFYDVHWQDYRFEFSVGDNWRKLSRLVTGWILFRKDSLPFLNQVPLYFGCTITPPKNLNSAETIIYQYRLRSIEDEKIYSPKSGKIEILSSGKTRIKLVTDIIQRTIQYVGEVRVSRNELEIENEQWQLFVSLTVLDKDIYSMEKVMTRLVDIVWFVLGIVVTIIIQKLLGVP